jgi:hypothetical protein
MCGSIVSPSTLAVLRLMISAHGIGCSTGRSAGVALVRLLSTEVAARRKNAGTLAPYAMSPPALAPVLGTELAAR